MYFFLYTVSFVQQKETVYILFDKAANGNYVGDEGGVVSFYMSPPIDASHFVFNGDKYKKQKISFKNVKRRLITKQQANEKVYAYVDKMAKEFEADFSLGGNIFRHPPYALNSYFEKIYIYEKIDDQSGVLYQVDWVYAIE